MTASEIMQSYCVKVNGGSGVLVNAMTREYSYVLTAAHVISEKQGNSVVHDYQGNPLTVLAVLPQPLPPQEMIKSEPQLYDFAILKVDYQERVAQKCLPASDLNNRASLTLVGFPETERGSSDPIKEYTGHKISVANELVMMSLDGIPGTTTIKGMSGGGVYHVQDETPLLIGIEFQMDGTGQDQQYGRVQCHSLARFEEIITAHSSAPMIPAYLECFSNMQDKIFSFNVDDPNNVSDLKLELEMAAKYLIENNLLPPYKVMEQYHADLLVDPENLNELKTCELWVAYLEFLVISVLIDQSTVADDAYLKDLGRKRRLVYSSDGTNWIRRLDSLFKTARRLLDKGGTLIIASPEPTAKVTATPTQLDKVISNISVVPTQGPFTAIDSVDSFESAMLASYTLTHLEGLQRECVVEIEGEYPNVPQGRSKSDLLREKLSEIIN
ncbi:MAG: trypsin-like peptidase domain-containing protein [Moritella sp.]|uniref:ABC-three component system protein n=1 Tax=Moritella sp. TaxID=78556 RepID=UPI0025CEF40F|nr:ABC-three component system protein [Moritella sp.]NQZ92059.1 trypsin-like peptidase domain-containing protein [Moritella sp.]